VPIDGKMVDNPYGRWNQIDKSLPNQQITLVIPASNHGTREVFDEKVLIEGCKTFKEMAKLEGDAQKEACLKLRQDSGTVVEIAGDYTETLARLQAQADAIGVFGLSFYESNLDRLQIATIDGVTATQETVISGEYPVSRPLFFYVKGEHIGVIPGLIEFAQFFVSDAVSGVDSPLFEAGLIPLSDDERAKVLSNIKNRKVVGK
jgi:phosphate transport system substrate-binding protein